MRPSHYSRGLIGSAITVAAIALFALSPRASAAIIIYDTFTGADNTVLIGRMPSPDDLPGNSYAGNGNLSLVGGFTGGTPYENDIQSNRARLGADAGVAVNLSIVTPAQFQLSLDFNVNNQSETQANNPHRGAGLGFFSSVAVGSGGSFHCFNNFTGLTVDRTGSIRLIIAGVSSGIFTTVAGFDPTIMHTLAYQVNTAVGVGTISNILLDGSSVSLTAAVNTFTIARATYAGFYNSSGPLTELSDFDNFYIETVPEPATLFGVAAITTLICSVDLLRRRKRSNG